MNKQLIQYAVGFFVGVVIYRLAFKNEDWIRSVVASAFISIGATLGMYFYYKWKAKKSA